MLCADVVVPETICLLHGDSYRILSCSTQFGTFNSDGGRLSPKCDSCSDLVGCSPQFAKYLTCNSFALDGKS